MAVAIAWLACGAIPLTAQAALVIERAQGEPVRPKLEQARLAWQEALSQRDGLIERQRALQQRQTALLAEQDGLEAELARARDDTRDWRQHSAEQADRRQRTIDKTERLRQAVAAPLAQLSLARSQGQDDAALFRLETVVKAMLAKITASEAEIAELTMALDGGEAQALAAAEAEAKASSRLAEIAEALPAMATALHDLTTDLASWSELTEARAAEHQRLEAIVSALAAEAELIIAPPPVALHPILAPRLPREWPAAPARPHTLPEADGTVMPVDGEIVSHFGEPLAAPLDQGILIQAAPGSRIVAPRAGQVVFAGPFQRYGRLLIIDHGDGYHTLLAGFDWLGVEENVKVETGQLVGSLASDRQGNSRLYLELRQRGKPANPLPWLAARSDKVRG